MYEDQRILFASENRNRNLLKSKGRYIKLACPSTYEEYLRQVFDYSYEPRTLHFGIHAETNFPQI